MTFIFIVLHESYFYLPFFLFQGCFCVHGHHKHLYAYRYDTGGRRRQQEKIKPKII